MGTHQDSVTLWVARDRRTGLPCVRADRNERFIAVFPVTKHQVEQLLSSENVRVADPDKMRERLELNAIPTTEHGRAIYPENVARLKRVPIPELKPGNLLSIVATNLTLWANPSEIEHDHVTFPTRASEWGHVLRWLKAEVPTADRWRATRDFYSQFQTKDLIGQICRLSFRWDPTVEDLLQRCRELISERDRGLPFMNRGLYELIADAKDCPKLAAEGIGTYILWRPFVAGDSEVWPTLNPPGVNEWRAVLKEDVPVVAIRPCFQDASVTDTVIEGSECRIQVRVSPLGGEADSENHLRRARTRAPRNPGRTVYRADHPMRRRCPACYQRVDGEVFDAWGRCLWCFVKRELAEGEQRKVLERGQHTNRPPAEGSDVRGVEAIHRDYLEVARRDSRRIRSVCLSGYTEAGKGTWLLSLAGMMRFPEGNSRFTRALPEERNLTVSLCDMKPPDKAEKPVNLTKQVEDLWIDGDVPERNSPLERALRSPFLFRKEITGILGKSSTEECVVIFNDIAGEIIDDPVKLARSGFFNHVCCTTDVIFIQPAHTLNAAMARLNGFANSLGAIEFEKETAKQGQGTTLDTRDINLIFAISQIDRLKHSRSEEARELLKIMLQEPYVLPGERNEQELMDYLKGVKDVHFGLQDWFRRHQPNTYQICRRFASVRFCGFSAFGCEPVPLGKKAATQAYLVFEPQPVRVVDPLFWLLRDSGLIKF